MKQQLKTFIRATEETMNKGYNVPEGFVGKMGIVFTIEEYNQHIQDVIKQTLTRASERAELSYECGNKTKQNCLAVFCRNCTEQIDRESITNTFDDTFKKYNHE